MKKISVIIPTYNGRRGVNDLTHHLANTLNQQGLEYELIYIDDHSTDGTVDYLNSLKEEFPIRTFPKQGKKGKAYAYLEGFQHSEGDIIVQIDADLLYSPDAIPAMIKGLDNFDIVVANRKFQNLPLFARILNNFYKYVFGKLLFGLNCDVYSGLKVFKKEILGHVAIQSTHRTFDANFLYLAKRAGYLIENYDIALQKRISGKVKSNLPVNVFELFIAAFKLRFSKSIVIAANSSILEPARDWSLGPLSGHRLQVVAYMAIGMTLLYVLQSWLWPVSKPPHTIIEHIWSWGSLLWLGAVIPGTMGLAGMLTFRHPKRLDTVKPINTLVSWRIVSRGTNVEALFETIRRCQTEMTKTPLFPYIIEVVIDNPLNTNLPPPNNDLRYIVVPHEYHTLNEALYKARALHYAVEHSPLPDNAWIVHLDEETQPTSSGIKGICAMIKEEEASGTLRIGQGAILYHRQWKKYPFLTLADNVRTGDDFARFHFQHKLGVTVFGLHGSYIVVRSDIEKSIGFDFGPNGSMTEDAFWALVAMERGYRCRWIDGYLEEQSTQSIMDFLRQRRRWFQGLAKVSIHAPVKLKWRLSLGLNTFLWALAPFASLYTFGHFFFGFQHEWWIRFLANYSFTSFEVLYLIGLKANLDEYGVTNWFKRAGWLTSQVVLLPFFSLLESLGVLAAVFRPVSGFHVVKK